MMSDGAHQLVARLSKPAEEHADEKTRSDSRRKPGAAAGVAPLDPPGGCQERGEHAQRRTASQPERPSKEHLPLTIGLALNPLDTRVELADDSPAQRDIAEHSPTARCSEGT